ncbi:hypothetical protein BC628DRAFT_1339875 [Trametes gibbosa]|nr:hypothetical protein BC628DRAFT_1339875 [Trametes gibbosa]
MSGGKPAVTPSRVIWGQSLLFCQQAYWSGVVDTDVIGRVGSHTLTIVVGEDAHFPNLTVSTFWPPAMRTFDLALTDSTIVFIIINFGNRAPRYGILFHLLQLLLLPSISSTASSFSMQNSAIYVRRIHLRAMSRDEYELITPAENADMRLGLGQHRRLGGIDRDIFPSLSWPSTVDSIDQYEQPGTASSASGNIFAEENEHLEVQVSREVATALSPLIPRTHLRKLIVLSLAK